MLVGSRNQRAALLVFVCGLLAGCTSLLGDFSIGGDGGLDATADGTVEGSPGAEGGFEASTDDGGPGPEAGDDAAEGGPSCTGGGMCSAAACQTGVETCDGGSASCSPAGNVLNGTMCDAGAVCDNGSCAACAVGTDCTEAGSCQAANIVCTSGAPVCTPMGNAPNGTPCGTNMYCNTGVCKACTNGAPCTPSGSPCHTGTLTCSGGNATCTDTGNAAANGTSCGTNMVCDNGSCVACTAGTSCNPGGNVCKTGATSCSTGTQTCNTTGNAPNGTICGTNETCTSGACGCKSGFTMCSGTCVDTTSDPANCGVCGHGCLNGSCSASKCQPWTVTTTGGGQWTTDGTWVAYNDTIGDIRQIKTTGVGGSVVSGNNVLNQTASGPAMANGTVAWLGNGISVFTASDGATSNSAKATWPAGYTPTFITLAPNATNAYVVGQQSVSPWNVYLYSCTLSGQPCVPLNSGNAIETPGTAGYQTSDLQASANYAFWIYTNGANDFVRSYNFGTKAITSVGSTYPTALTLDANSVYWAAQPNYTVYRAAQGSIGSPSSVTTVAYSVQGLASDGKYVYIGTLDTSGAASVYYAPVGASGATATVLFTSAANPSSEGPVFAAGGAVYWADTDDSQCPAVTTIRGIAAPP